MFFYSLVLKYGVVVVWISCGLILLWVCFVYSVFKLCFFLLSNVFIFFNLLVFFLFIILRSVFVICSCFMLSKLRNGMCFLLGIRNCGLILVGWVDCLVVRVIFSWLWCWLLEMIGWIILSGICRWGSISIFLWLICIICLMLFLIFLWYFFEWLLFWVIIMFLFLFMKMGLMIR